MSRAKNSKIGMVECPHKGCAEQSAVYRFKARGAGRSRFAGKLYADCPVHGRYGADGKQGAQEYILENAVIDGAAPVPAPVAPVAAAPVPAPVAPADHAPIRAAAVNGTARPNWLDAWSPLIK